MSSKIENIKQTVEQCSADLHYWTENTPSYTDLGATKYRLNCALSDLHGLGRAVETREFFRLNNELKSMLQMCDDLRRDKSGRAARIEAAVIEISKERFGGELWREVLQRAKALRLDAGQDY